MPKILNEILDWSEVWAPLIPLLAYMIYKPTYKWSKPVLYYLLAVLFFSILIVIVHKSRVLGLYDWLLENFGYINEKGKGVIKNTVFYNLISIARLMLFAWFFNFLGSTFTRLYKFVPHLFLILTALNFLLFEKIADFSSRLISFESGILLLYCIFYFFKMTLDEKIQSASDKAAFWVVTGLSIYVAFNFFIFLFFKFITWNFKSFAIQIWPIHNIANIIFCIFIAIAFRTKNERSTIR